MPYQTVGETAHYSISYDTSLSQADGRDRAIALLSKCEEDFALMASWFPGVTLTFSTPIDVHIDVGSYASASWGPPISLKPGNGSSLDVVRYLLVAEVTEMFMLAQNKGWFAADRSNEASNGEGLSRFLAAQFLAVNGLGRNMPGFDTAGLWLNSLRQDFVNHIDEFDHNPDEKSGCSVLFLYYLNVQIGFDVISIVTAADPTLAGVYRNLTKDMVDPFPDFKQILDNAFPTKSPDGSSRAFTVPGLNPDNPFPLSSFLTLSTQRYIAALPPEQRTDSIRSLITRSGTHTLRLTLNSNRRAALL